MDLKLGISIIIPTYNEATSIKVLLEVLFSQSKLNIVEIIIVDAAKSNDNLKEQINNYPITYISSKNTNRACQLNEGASKAKHEILYFLHADALPPKGFIDSIFKSIHDGYDFGYFRYSFASNKPFLKINSFLSQFKGFYTGGGDQSCYIKKDIFESVDRFNESLELCEDFDLFDRLKAKNFRYQILNSKLIISPRKYESNNYLKVNYANLYVLRNFRKGVSTKLLNTYKLA